MSGETSENVKALIGREGCLVLFPSSFGHQLGHRPRDQLVVYQVEPIRLSNRVFSCHNLFACYVESGGRKSG
jgi:hypothetical protein